jgi:activating signal cointegrator 1
MSTQIGLFKSEMLRIPPPGTDWLVLSMTQPWASALFTPHKRIETRSWRTNYRGRLYIQAAKGFPRYAKEFAAEECMMGRCAKSLRVGVILGHVDLVDIKRTEDLAGKISAMEESYGDYGKRRYGWITENPVLLDEPIEAKGSLGLWKFTVTEAQR